MNKTEKRRLTIKLICEMIGIKFPDYSIDEAEGGRMNFSPSWGNMDDDIEFSRGDYSLCTLNWVSDRCKQDEIEMQKEIDLIVKQVNEME